MGFILDPSYSNGLHTQMTTKILHVFAVIVTVWTVGLVHVKGDVDCSQRPPHADLKTCCPVPNLISDELLEKCQQTSDMPTPPPPPEAMSGESHPHHGHRGPRHNNCFHSCVLNETGIFVDGQLDAGNLEAYLNDNLGDTRDMIPILQESFEKCVEQKEEIMENMRKHFENKQKGPPRNGHGPPHGRCPPEPGMVMFCTMTSTLKRCPASIWTDTDECNAARAFFTECQPPRKEE